MVVDELIGAALIKPVEVANTQAAEGGCHWHSCATCGRQQHVSSSAVACSRAGLRRDLDHSSLLDAGALRIPFATREPLLDTCEITHRAAIVHGACTTAGTAFFWRKVCGDLRTQAAAQGGSAAAAWCAT